MKTLLLLRHGKAEPKESASNDHDRPLAERGRADAPRMGQLLAQEGLAPDEVVSSPALRARETAELAAGEAGFSGEVRFDDRIYENTADDLLAVVRDLPDEAQRVMLVGHNPGFEHLLTTLVGSREELPAAALAKVDFEVGSWRDATSGLGRTPQGWRPKELTR